MPLRDHFHPPVSRQESWEAIHAMWPAVIVQQLKTQLPPGYISAPRVHVGPYFEVDIGSFELDSSASLGSNASGLGDPQLMTWKEAEPTVAVETEIPDEAAYEVKIYDVERERTLVAVIEIVSPANKDREESRRKFVAKCAALLQQGVAVTIVDIVTVRQANLYVELMQFLGHADPSMADCPSLYTASSRWVIGTRKARLESWANRLSIGQRLPPIPIWLSPQQVLTFDLEQSYEKVCDDLNVK
jgi:hypothetical protein